MQASLEDFFHDAAVLHRFVEFVEDYCGEQERSQTYIDASGLFFKYARRLAASIRQVLCAKVKPDRIAMRRGQVAVLKKYLQQIHMLLKPAADAHTLTIPAPLIRLASEQLQGVRRMTGASVVTLLTPRLMYLQRPHTDVKDQAKNLEEFMPRPKFPSKLGFIELPYSQGQSLFTNIAIYHEIGHIVYEEFSIQDKPHPALVTLDRITLRTLRKIYKDRDTFVLGAEIVDNWTREVFCDLFALRLVGPAFSFALVEILGMLGSLSQRERVRFDHEHPASAFRFAEHLELLREDSWWDAIDDIEPAQKKLITELAEIPRTQYRFYSDDGKLSRRGLVNGFIDSIVPAVRRLVTQLTPEAKPAAMRFRSVRTTVEDCLSVGVVPHPSAGVAPDPVSIINASFCFYLSKFPKVIAKFEGRGKEHDVKTRSRWTKKLEDWTMKAIEDSQIRADFERSSYRGPF